MRDYHIFDGAFGTWLPTKNLLLELPETANQSHPEIVLDIHREYIASGADAIKTNTFAANSTGFAGRDTLRPVIQSGYALAAEAAAGSDVTVFADMGPLSHDGANEEYQELADIFIGCGATNFLFETLHEALPLAGAIAHIRRRVPGARVVVSFAAGQDGYTKSGNYFLDLFEQAMQCGADMVGLNCICGPAHMLNLIRHPGAGKYRLAAMPNAGYPSVAARQTVYVDNPGYFADKLLEMYREGVTVLGGCCGTTPRHIEALAKRMREAKPEKRPGVTVTERQKPTERAPLDTQRTAIAVEVSPPFTNDITYALEAGRLAKARGADFVTVPDSPLGKARANSFMIASRIQREAGISAIPHICCRDKNQLAVKGDLLAASIEGIASVLAITGDPVPETDRAEVKNVFGMNSYKLIRFIKSLNENLFMDRPFTIMAALNINAANFELELARAREKMDNGATCFMTQPLFSDEHVGHYLRARETLGCKVLAGIMPVAGYKNAMFLQYEVPGIEIPPHILQRLKDQPPDAAREISLGYAKSLVDKVRVHCDGYYIITPLTKIDYAAELITYIRESEGQ